MHSNQLVRTTYIISNNKMWHTKTYILPLNKWTINIQNSTGMPFSINDAIFIFVISYPFLFFFFISWSLVLPAQTLWFVHSAPFIFSSSHLLTLFFLVSFFFNYFWYLSQFSKTAFLLYLLCGETSFFISQNKTRRLQNHSGFLKN